MVLNEQQIIESCGDFSREKNILKRYARRGQCFSTAKFVTMLHPSQLVINHPDIKRNGYCFTDGAGCISHRLAEIISKDHFGLNYTASAF
jgi:RNA-dependent RNA polymerase